MHFLGGPKRIFQFDFKLEPPNRFQKIHSVRQQGYDRGEVDGEEFEDIKQEIEGSVTQ